ncbi:MAG TPA: glycoside hydrolase family 3 N-terminal domain-containing protein, partial [Candidatus Sulfopaludibacter sp.]|nr:glycoside hydrolase family 3 N-terminal domain-containing protein [Candidatus Sulfopaludibacter sp.]
MERVQSVAAREARASGIAWTFAPMVDIARDPRWGRMIEGAGEDPFLGAAMARAQVRGFQGTSLNAPDRLLACAKHFAGYGAADGGRDYDSSYLPESQLWNVYLPPFLAALEAGVGTFMSAYMDLNDVPATGNAFLLQDVLRREWKFNGFVVSDANAVRDLITHGFAADAAGAARRAFTAGVDMDMASGTYMKELPALVRAGEVPIAAIDAAVRQVLAAKGRLGLFERPYTDEALAKRVAAGPEHRQLARLAAQRSAVLLRNEGGLLPLAKGAGPIAVIGPLADSQSDLLTMWAGATFSTPAESITIVQGIRNKAGAGVRVEYAPGVQIARRYPSIFEQFLGGNKTEAWPQAQAGQEFDKALEMAKRAGTVVMVLGELATMDGESASQGSLMLPGRQDELLWAVAATGKPLVLVLVNGRPLDIEWAASHVPAILEAWHPGNEGGNAVADLLFGDANPGGKLPVTWPRNAGQVPIYYSHNLTHQPESSPGFQSRYWDQPGSPLFPFGYGLSYTKFGIANLQAGRNEVTAEVENTGARSGDEVVQLYLHQRSGSASRPVRELKGFERVTLAPGEKRTVRFRLGPEALRYWSAARHAWVQDAADFDVWVGSDAAASLHATFSTKN